MSALLRLGLATTKTNQFIKPIHSFDVVFTACRPTLRGQGFAATLDYAKAIPWGLVDKFMYAVMAAVSDAEALSMEDTSALINLYTCTNCAQNIPLLMTDAGGDEAAGSPVMCIALAHSKRVPSALDRMNILGCDSIG